MIAAARPLATATAALLGAGVIAATPVVSTAPLTLPTLQAPDIALQASIIDILGFPVYQQAIANEVEFVAIRAAGLAQGGAGLAQSLAQLPATLITAVQQTLGGDPLEALTTVEDWLIGTGSAALVPPVLANIDVGQIQLAIQSALLLAQPTALVQLGASVFGAFDTITRSFIVAGQDFVNAVLSLNIGNIVQAVVGGVTGVIDAFVTGGGIVIDGIAAAQTTLVTALQARPGPVALPLAAPAAATPRSAAATAESGDDTATAVAELPSARAAADEAQTTLAAPAPAAEPDTTSGTGVRTGSGTVTQRGVTAARAAASRAADDAGDDGGPAKAGAKRGAAR